MQNEFPVFDQTGDVEIVLKRRDGSGERRYVLHRLILSQSSGYFEEALQGGPAATTRRDGLGTIHEDSGTARTRWRFELDWQGDEAPRLVQRESPFPPLSSTPQPRVSQFTNDPDDPIQNFDNLFRIFYNHTPSLDSINIATAYVQSKALLQLADLYDAIHIIGPRVDHHLLRFQGRLWKQIAKYPPSYLKLGYMAHSKAIFAEALVHVVGQWPQGRDQLRHGQISDLVLDLIEDKVDELDAQMARVEGRLWRVSLTTSRGERVGPTTSWSDWLVMSLWRQWFAENTTAKESSARTPSPPPVNMARILRLVGAGGSAYLDHDEMKRFLKIRSENYSRDALRRFERRMDDLKALVREAVRPLMRNHLELDLSGAASLPYLTCVRVDDRDFVWEG